MLRIYVLHASQVISDPEKRKIYDMYGEEGLKAGPPPPGGGGFPGGFPGGGGGFPGGGGFRYQPRSAHDIFSEVCPHPYTANSTFTYMPCPHLPLPHINGRATCMLNNIPAGLGKSH